VETLPWIAASQMPLGLINAIREKPPVIPPTPLKTFADANIIGSDGIKESTTEL